MPDRIRVLWVAKGLGPGGMERLLVHHAACGDRSTFEYHAAYVTERPHGVVGELESAGVVVHRLTDRTGPLGWATSLRRLARREQIHVVHFHSPALAAVGRTALRTMTPRPGVITTEHNSWDCYGWPTRIANAVTSPLDDRRLAVSSDAVTSTPRPFRRHAEVLVHGIPLGTPLGTSDRRAVRGQMGVSPEATVVVTVANHRREKAWDVLIAAAGQVGARCPGTVFLGVGHGPLEDRHRALVRDLGLEGTVRLLGFRDDVAALLSASDVFALASRQEGLPVAIMEAMAAGLPVVATRVGGLPDAIVDGVSGVLVPANDVQALAGALERMVTDPDLRTRLGHGARRAASQFDVVQAVSVIERRYREIAG